MDEFPPWTSHQYHINDRTVTVVCAKGSLTEGDIEPFRELVLECCQSPNKRILLDLGKVEYIDDHGGSLLILFATRLKSEDKEFAVIKPSGLVKMFLSEWNLATSFPIFTDYPDLLNW